MKSGKMRRDYQYFLSIHTNELQNIGSIQEFQPIPSTHSTIAETGLISGRWRTRFSTRKCMRYIKANTKIILHAASTQVKELFWAEQLKIISHLAAFSLPANRIIQ